MIETLITRIKLLRKEQNVTQTGFADILGVDPSYISALETGKAKNPSKALIKNICAHFQINEEWLRTGKGPKNKQVGNDPEGDDVADLWKVTPEMLKNYPELRHLLLYASEDDREGFDLQLEHFAKRREKEKEEGQEHLKWSGVERRQEEKES